MVINSKVIWKLTLLTGAIRSIRQKNEEKIICFYWRAESLSLLAFFSFCFFFSLYSLFLLTPTRTCFFHPQDSKPHLITLTLTLTLVVLRSAESYSVSVTLPCVAVCIVVRSLPHFRATGRYDTHLRTAVHGKVRSFFCLSCWDVIIEGSWKVLCVKGIAVHH